MVRFKEQGDWREGWGGEDLFGAILDHGDDEARPLPFLLHESFLLLLLQKWAGGRQEKAAFFISFQGEKAWASDDAISWAFEAHLCNWAFV